MHPGESFSCILISYQLFSCVLNDLESFFLSPTLDKEIKLHHQAGFAEMMIMLREKFKTHEWLLLSLYISNPDVDDIETEQSMVVYEVSISGYRKWRGK